VGVTFVYSPDGVPVGLCRAEKLYYVTTAGGPVSDDSFGYGYVRALAEGFYGIPETRLVKAEGLDVIGADVEAILRRAEREIDALFAD
jgi:FMN-dependent NADH-azoreductase